MSCWPAGLPLPRPMPFLAGVFRSFQIRPCEEEAVIVDSINDPDVAGQPRRSLLNACVFVWSIWMMGLLGCLLLVIKYGNSIPYGDEWHGTVPIITGERPLTLQNLWSLHNEHRIFLPRLISWGLLKLSAGDVRAGMLFNVSILALMAALFILAARRLRGWTTYSDAFFPLAMLQLGQWENLLWGFQVTFICPIALVYVFLLVIVRDTGPVSLTKGLLAGLTLLLLTLSGAI